MREEDATAGPVTINVHRSRACEGDTRDLGCEDCEDDACEHGCHFATAASDDAEAEIETLRERLAEASAGQATAWDACKGWNARAEQAEAEVGRLRQELAEANRRYEERTPTQWAYEQACHALETHRARADAAEAEVQRLRLLVRDLADPDLCRFDHHGGCQAHGYLDLETGERCPQAEAGEIRDIIDAASPS